MALKFMATVRMIRAVLPGMIERRYGRIVTLVGNSGREPDPRMLPSAAANAGLLAVTAVWRVKSPNTAWSSTP